MLGLHAYGSWQLWLIGLPVGRGKNSYLTYFLSRDASAA